MSGDLPFRGRTPLSATERAESVQKRFRSRYEAQPNGCWLWQGRTLASGHGVLKSSGRNLRAHVVSWELHRGPTGGQHVLHRCGNAACVNPEHLYLGTPRQNSRDAAAHGVVPGQRLTGEDVLDVRRLLRDGWTRRRIASRFGVSRLLIGKIARNDRWGWLQTRADLDARRAEAAQGAAS